MWPWVRRRFGGNVCSFYHLLTSCLCDPMWVRLHSRPADKGLVGSGVRYDSQKGKHSRRRMEVGEEKRQGSEGRIQRTEPEQRREPCTGTGAVRPIWIRRHDKGWLVTGCRMRPHTKSLRLLLHEQTLPSPGIWKEVLITSLSCGSHFSP